MTQLYAPLHSLREGHWFKLICGASFQHLPAVRNLTLAYTLAGADCIDVAADPAVIAAAREGLTAAAAVGEVAQQRGFGFKGLPWLMVSLNDGEDPHFRKAEFNPAECPVNCPRPCEQICPAQAIIFSNANESSSGVIDQRCYGCGRCVPVCPHQLIFTRSYVSAPDAIAPLVFQTGVDALEIHTQVGRLADFERLWRTISPWVDKLKLLAISCPDGVDLIDYLMALYKMIAPLPCPLIWQTDGRPMSGDIGDGTTRAAVKLGQKVLSAGLPGYVQLAGGTNSHTVTKLRSAGLLSDSKLPISNFESKNVNPKSKIHRRASGFPQGNPKFYVAGVAYGSYARVLMSPVLDQLEKVDRNEAYARVSINQTSSARCLEDDPTLLWQAVATASSLVSQLKLNRPTQSAPALTLES